MADRPTSTQRHSILATWSPIYDKLKGTRWNDCDVVEAWYRKHHAPGSRKATAVALKYAYDKVDEGDEGALAVLKAAHRWRRASHISPADVADIADNFYGYYDAFDAALWEHMDRRYGSLPARYLNDEGRAALRKEIMRDSQIWVDEADVPGGLLGVWVFAKPGWSRS